MHQEAHFSLCKILQFSNGSSNFLSWYEILKGIKIAHDKFGSCSLWICRRHEKVEVHIDLVEEIIEFCGLLWNHASDNLLVQINMNLLVNKNTSWAYVTWAFLITCVMPLQWVVWAFYVVETSMNIFFHFFFIFITLPP